MGQTDGVEDKGISGHSNPALSIRPPQKLVTIMFKDRRPEDTFLAVTNGARHHAVMTSDTGRESVHKRLKVFNHSLEFFKDGIPLLRSFGDNFGDHIISGGWFILRVSKDSLLLNLLFQSFPYFNADFSIR